MKMKYGNNSVGWVFVQCN